MQKTQVQSLVWEYPLEKEMVTHSSILAWEIPWTEKRWAIVHGGHKKVEHDLVTKKQEKLQIFSLYPLCGEFL